MLLPCPFCGDSLVEKGDSYLAWFAHGEDSTCLLRLVDLYDEADFQRWNRRVTVLGDLERLLTAEVGHAFVADIFAKATRLEDLPIPAQEYVVRNKEEAYRDGWQLGFVEGCSHSKFRPKAFVDTDPHCSPGGPIDGYQVGDAVEVAGGDRFFPARIVAAFSELWGAPRFVLEDGRGVLHMYGSASLRRLEEPSSPAGAHAVPEPLQQTA